MPGPPRAGATVRPLLPFPVLGPRARSRLARSGLEQVTELAHPCGVGAEDTVEVRVGYLGHCGGRSISMRAMPGSAGVMRDSTSGNSSMAAAFSHCT